MEFADFSNANLIEFAESALNCREWTNTTGNRHTGAGQAADTLWAFAECELSARGLLADFKYERGMD